MSDPNDRWSVSLEDSTLLGRYTVERKIGGGGMANVYLARDDQLEMPVVVKVPHAAYLAEPGFRERFERETRDLISLQHPHIVRILARGEHEGLPFLVLQFLQGGSLGDRLRRAGGGPIPYEALRPWIRDLARALDFIHEQGVVHRDIKPDNVLFDEHDHAYLSDFGIAKAVGGADTGLTVTGTTPGSPAYMAPEQPRQSSLTGASDQYSLAATIYEALSGRPTHEGETAVDVLLKKQTELPPILADVAPAVPPAVSAAVMRALQRNPEDRWPRCADLAAAFDQPTPPTAPTAPLPVPPPPTAPADEAVARAAPAGGGGATGTTLTLSGSSRKTIWMVLTVLCLGVPLALLFLDSGEGDGGAGGATDVAALDGTEDGKKKLRGVPPLPEVRAVSKWERDLVGTWRLDKEMLERRIKELRTGGKRPIRKQHGLRELERLRRSDHELILHADGRFTLLLQGPDGTPAQRLHGTWKGAQGTVEFHPEGPNAVGPRGAPLRVFQGRVAKGGLMLEMAGRRLFLNRN